MKSWPIAAMIGLFLATIAQGAPAETPGDQRCAKGADVRRIEIRFADDAGSLPCKVIYRPEADSDTVGIVSWQDLTSPDACKAQANEVIERLTGEGWTCAIDQTTAGDQGDETIESVPTDGAAEAGLAETREWDIAALENLPPVGADDADDPGSLEEVDEPATFVENPDIRPPSDDLAALIRSDLGRLDTTLDGVLKAKIAGYGDLDEDGIEDALVLYTYTSPQPAYRQFLAAYMSDGEIYQLTATRPVGGNVSATKEAKVEAIDRGVVHLSLRAFEPGDASCCPSGTRHLALALRDLDLVEIDADILTR